MVLTYAVTDLEQGLLQAATEWQGPVLTWSVTLRRDSSAGHVSRPWRRGWNGSLIFPDTPLGVQHRGQAALCCGPLLIHRHFKSPQNKAVAVLGARAGRSLLSPSDLWWAHCSLPA